MRHISTTALSKKLGITSRELFDEFEKLEWITPERTLTVDGFSVGAIYKEIKKEGETIKYIAWPENIEIGVKPQDAALITATKLSSLLKLPALRINYILAELAWIKKGELNKGWIATQNGLTVGAIQAEDKKSGVPYIRWPAAIATHPSLVAAVADFNGNAKSKISNPDIITFRDRFAAKYLATDGHTLRSEAETLIDNWLYLFGIAHACERKLPIEDEVYASFYIPSGHVYLEYFGCETDASYGYDKNCQHRKQETLDIYAKHNLSVIELEDKDIQNLDEVLPKKLLKYGVQTY